MRRLLAIAVALTLAGAGPSFAGAVITHTSGLVKLGVNDAGHLNFEDPGSQPTNMTDAWGVSFDFGGGDFRDATSPGCYCEGWGVAVNGANSGYANEDDGGATNLTVDSFLSTASTATSVVHLSDLDGITVTHEYAPSTSGALFQAKVTIANTTGGEVDLKYRRVMDWDVPPTEFNEFVTIGGWNADNLVASTNDGFKTANPLDLSLVGIGPGCGVNANFVKCGASDHGALFDFAFDDVANGDSVEFFIYYGAAVGEGAIFGALATVGAEVYSLGYSSTSAEGGDDVPNTNGVVYAFGFSGVGGEPIEPVPEPGTMLLLGSGVTALALRRRRKA